MSKIKIFSLGGLNENGKNLYVVNVDRDIFVFDAGLKYDNDLNLGIDYIIPNFDYLIKNKKNIKGIFLTHGHESNIGAVPDILEQIPSIPVYGTKLTLEMLKNDLEPENVKEYDYELKVVYEGNEYKTGVWGKYTITPKIISIEDIIATNKVYNGNTTVVISGGRLIDVCEGDNLYFELPLTGEAESRNVGTWRVSIEEIKLLGEDAPNYILTHPKYGDITVEITSRPLRTIWWRKSRINFNR